MMIVGLTGSIAVGKSEVAQIFAQHGIPVFDADKTVHELYQEEEVASEMARIFPTAVVDGRVDRHRLSQHLQKAPEDFAPLEALIHPLVRSRMMASLGAWRKEGRAIVVLDIPLLFETGLDRLADRIVLVTSPKEIQRTRALQRPGMSEEKLAMLLARQTPPQAKPARCIIDNAGTLSELKAHVDKVIVDLKREAEDF